MKPSHFLYKSDGLYYMQNVPDKKDYETHGHFDSLTSSKDGMHEYKQALERAKAEAVLVTEPYVYQKAMHRYFPHFIDYSKTPLDNFAMCASIGQVYILNMEEEIEVVDIVTSDPCLGMDRCPSKPRCPETGTCKRRVTEKIARIAEPKNRKSMQEQNTFMPLSKEQYDSPENQNRDNPIIGFRKFICDECKYTKHPHEHRCLYPSKCECEQCENKETS